MDLKQVWFTGAHSNVGGSYKPDNDGSLLSDNALEWMMAEATKSGLSMEPHLKKGLNPNPNATLHNSRRSFYRVKGKYYRDIDHGMGDVLIHKSVKQRWDSDNKYRPKNLAKFIDDNGWPSKLE
jgi:hypothetical protein